MKRSAVFTGSFDPPTVGHFDVIKRASPLFDEIHVVMTHNSEKKYMFSPDELYQLLEAMKKDLEDSGINNVIIAIHHGLTSEYMKENNIRWIIRGIRNSVDYDYEYSLANIMKKFVPDSDTILLPVSPEYMHVSSTYARDLIKYKCPLDDAITPHVIEKIKQLINQA